ncbi:MAG TPA: preprotein translocase subunit SecG [Bacteroidales bacterium]|nr:MAG: preprotein translocase subunit SecG [Bacteroidetes bacterium GWF2_33_38]OFY74010.1 MAG: preprotein translocase subunit SecG [Bacteroidetes bacterium RIFOXYA12_FULL_33_9]HBF88923.1 preprotein translocase subunit SecG [Bacteroidales bacterium]
MYYLISALILIASVLLILIVLVQNSKGGGLAANFAGSTQSMGVRKTADFLEKATWTLAIIIISLTLLSSLTINRGEGEDAAKKSLIENQINEAVDPTAAPIIPTVDPQQAPAQQKDTTK